MTKTNEQIAVEVGCNHEETVTLVRALKENDYTTKGDKRDQLNGQVIRKLVSYIQELEAK